MYRLLIVDDEQIVLDSLQIIFKKQYEDECRVETAKSGREAIARAEANHPDIILMDISMPGINGIDAIRTIRDFLPSVVIILLTAFDKFDYAKQAINLGVYEYLMKPVNKSRIIQTIDGAISQVDQYRQRRYDDLAMREKLENVIGVLETGFIHALLFPESGQQDLGRYLEMLDINGVHGIVMTLEFGEQGDENGQMQNRIGSHVRLHRNYQTLREIIKSVHACLVGSLLLNRIVIFLPVEPEMLTALNLRSVYLGRKIIDKITERLNVAVRIGISNPCDTIEHLHQAWQESAQAAQYAIAGNLFLYKDLIKSSSDMKNYDMLEKQYFDALRGADAELSCLLFDDLFSCMQVLPLDQLKNRLMPLIVLTEQERQKRQSVINSNLDFCQIAVMQNAEEIKDLAHIQIRQVCDLIAGVRNRTATDMIEQAKKYIADNFHNSRLSLESTAEEISLSPHYFSRLFSSQVGMTFIDYLTDLRMRKAMDLLRNTDQSIKEISSNSGYADPNYFSRIFKKIIGKTPSEYR